MPCSGKWRVCVRTLVLNSRNKRGALASRVEVSCCKQFTLPQILYLAFYFSFY